MINHRFTTQLLTALALLASIPPRSSAQTRSLRQVVFVCEHGTVKSVVALEHFKRLARARGLDVEAISRGTKPDSIVPGPVMQGLATDGFDVSHFRARPLMASDLTATLLVVALDADVAPIVGSRVPVAHWDSLPSVMSNYATGRSAIVGRVERLVDSLVKAKAAARQ